MLNILQGIKIFVKKNEKYKKTKKLLLNLYLTSNKVGYILIL